MSISKYIFDPRKFAFRKTTKDPTHIITKIDVIMVDADSFVRIERVTERSKQRRKGPQRSPI